MVLQAQQVPALGHRGLKNPNGPRIQRTPAMAAGVTDHVWTLREIAALLDEPVSNAN